MIHHDGGGAHHEGATLIVDVILNSHLFCKVVDQNFTIIAMDAVYTSNLSVNMLVLALAQTVDELMNTNTMIRSYYMEVLEHTPSSGGSASYPATHHR
jgi:laccase